MHFVTSSWRNWVSAKCPSFAPGMGTSSLGPKPVACFVPVTIGDVIGNDSSAMLRADFPGDDIARETCCTSDTTHATTVSGDSFQWSVCSRHSSRQHP